MDNERLKRDNVVFEMPNGKYGFDAIPGGYRIYMPEDSFVYDQKLFLRVKVSKILPRLRRKEELFMELIDRGVEIKHSNPEMAFYVANWMIDHIITGDIILADKHGYGKKESVESFNKFIDLV